MKIWGYTISNADETDVLANALSSMVRATIDKIVLVDSGTEKALIHNQRLFVPVDEWLNSRKEYSQSDKTWNGTELVLLHHKWDDPGHARNWVLRWIEEQVDKPEWIVAVDSDELLSNEAESQLRSYLEQTPADVTNIVQPLLNLVQDERHCGGGHHSTWLCHARIHRVGTDKVWYTGSYHENEEYRGVRVQWTPRLIHTRMLFRKRLFLQRGHPTLRDAWSDLQMVDIPSDVTFHELEWPSDEKVVPFLADMRDQ